MDEILGRAATYSSALGASKLLAGAFVFDVKAGTMELAAREAVRGATGTRSTITKAEGILMERLGIGSTEAFKLLTNYSNNRNIKLAGIACGLVALTDNPAEAGALSRFIAELGQSRPQRLDPPQGSERPPC